MSDEYTPVDVRWQCPRGHFVAHANVHAQDVIDPGAYYGVSTTWEYTCTACERLDVGPYMYFGEPRIVVVRDSNELPPAELRCWRTTEEGRQWQAKVQALAERQEEAHRG